jgi:hypothetical protein
MLGFPIVLGLRPAQYSANGLSSTPNQLRPFLCRAPAQKLDLFPFTMRHWRASSNERGRQLRRPWINLWLCHIKRMRTATYIVAASLIGLAVWYVLGNPLYYAN